MVEENVPERWHREETYRSLIQIGANGLRFVLLANGGAAIAILGFLAKIYQPKQPTPHFQWSLAAFLLGVFLGGVAQWFAYRTQLALYNEQSQAHPRHIVWLRWAMALALAGVICFGVGSCLGVIQLSS